MAEKIDKKTLTTSKTKGTLYIDMKKGEKMGFFLQKTDFDLTKVKPLSKEETLFRLKEEQEDEELNRVSGVFQNFDEEDEL